MRTIWRFLSPMNSSRVSRWRGRVAVIGALLLVGMWVASIVLSALRSR